ncbi:MAG: hypothetical protein R3B55_03400 [Candidatus Paceibacterota bacterium]
MEKTLHKKSLVFWALIASVVCITIISVSPVIKNNRQESLALASKMTTAKDAIQKKDISGKRIINTLIVEDFSSRKSSHEPKIKQTIFIDGKSFEVISENINSQLKDGTYEVKGTLDLKTNKVTLTSAKFLGALSDGLRSESLDKKAVSSVSKTNAKKIAVFLVDYKDTASQPFYPQTVNEIMFGNGKFANYFKEVSYNRQSITGDVFGWYTIPQNVGSGVCQANPSDLESFIAGSPVNLNNYGNIVIITLCNGSVSNGSSNTSPQPFVINGTTYNKTITWVNTSASKWNQVSDQMTESMAGDHILTNLEHLLIHEFGHALGLSHTDGLKCQGTIPTTNCQPVILGNYFDAMSYETIGLHFNAWSKAKLGWFTNTELKTITQSGTYTITNLESQPSSLSSTSAKAYRIKPSVNSSKTPIWIEFRKANGFDSGIATQAFSGMQGGGGETPPYNVSENQNGIMIYKEGFEGSLGGQINAPSARLVYLRNSPNLGNSANPYQVSLNPGQTFSEPRYGLSITTLQPQNAIIQKFQVTMNPNLACTNLPPKLSTGFGNIPSTIARGNNATIWVSLTNMDYISCPNSNFVATLGSVPSGVLAANFTSGSVVNFLSNLAPDDERIVGLSIYVGPTTQVGQYNFPINITNSSSGLSGTLNIPINVI